MYIFTGFAEVSFLNEVLLFSMISSDASGRPSSISAWVIFSCVSLLFQIQYRCDFSSLIPKYSSVPSSVHTYCDISCVSVHSLWLYVHRVTCKRVKKTKCLFWSVWNTTSSECKTLMTICWFFIIDVFLFGVFSICNLILCNFLVNGNTGSSGGGTIPGSEDKLKINNIHWGTNEISWYL